MSDEYRIGIILFDRLVDTFGYFTILEDGFHHDLSAVTVISGMMRMIRIVAGGKALIVPVKTIQTNFIRPPGQTENFVIPEVFGQTAGFTQNSAALTDQIVHGFRIKLIGGAFPIISIGDENRENDVQYRKPFFIAVSQ